MAMRKTFAQIVGARSEEELKLLAHTKRFLERWTGDLRFREALDAGDMTLQEGAKLCGSVIDPWSLQPVFDPEFSGYRSSATAEDWPLTRLWDDYLIDMISTRNSLISEGNSRGFVPDYDSWRNRQVARVQFELAEAASGLVHAPISIEISRGCSVGCWFCGISAKDFGGNFSLQGGGHDEWLATLGAAKSVLGPAMEGGFLYWGTEPLDNPEYPAFLEAYRDTVGVVPQTTTAIPLRDIEFTKRVMQVAEGIWNVPNRFSVLTTPILKRIHKAFTPEELMSVELVQQMNGSLNKKSNAGKARARAQDSSERNRDYLEEEVNQNAPATIACVSGFLLNIVEKRVRLVTPCAPTAEYSDGYQTLAESHYSDPSGLADAMAKMISEHMKISLRGDAVLKLNPSYSFQDNGTKHWIQTPKMGLEAPILATLAPALVERPRTPVDLASLAISEGHDPIGTVALIEQLHGAGILVPDVELEMAAQD